jgi:probable HAF family extracellular repeat protein
MKMALWSFAAFAMFAFVEIWHVAAQTELQAHRHYAVIDTGTLGGPNSVLQNATQIINARGIALTEADTPQPDPNTPCFNPTGLTDCFLRHGALWKDGRLIDLGTLPGGYYSQALWVSANGLIAGQADNGMPDPLAGIPLEPRGVLWKDGSMIDLGTFGGNQSGAISVNSRGQVAGFALNTIPDSLATAFTGQTGGTPAATQSRAFLWQNGTKQDLGTLGGPDALAIIVNEPGHVTGYAYVSSTPDPNTGIPPIHPFLWARGRMIDLGTFGGAVGIPLSMNNRGQVVGYADLAGDQAAHPFLWDRGHLIDLGTLGGTFGIGWSVNEEGAVAGWTLTAGNAALHTFLWKRGQMQDLGALPGELCSIANFINSKEQIVGLSNNCDDTSHATLWEKGLPPVDLNALIPASADMHIAEAMNINDAGEIIATADVPNGDSHAVLLVPCPDDDRAMHGCEAWEERTSADLGHSFPLKHHPEVNARVQRFLSRFPRKR